MLGPEGCGDITTRANFQIRGMTLAEADKIFFGLREVGLSSVQSGEHACRACCVGKLPYPDIDSEYCYIP